MKRPLELWHITTPNVMWVRDHFHPKYPCFLEKKQFGTLVYECPTELFIRNVCKLTIPANLQLTIPIQGFCKLMIINDILSRIFVSHLFSRPVIWTGIQPHRIDAVLACRPADRRKRKVVAPRRSSVSCKSFFPCCRLEEPFPGLHHREESRRWSLAQLTATASAKNGLLFLTGNPSGQILMTNLPTDWIWNGVMHVLVNLVSVACYLSPGLAMSRLITANTVRVDHTHRTHTLR